MHSLLQERDFLRVWVAGGLGGTVRWLETLAVGVYTLAATGSAFTVALMLFARAAPTALFGAFAGAVAERVPRLVVLRAGLATMVLVAGGLAVLAHSGRLALWHVALGAFLNGTFFSLEFPARRTMVAEIAGLARVGTAMSLDSATNNATRMLGPLLGGFLFASLGLAGAYVLSASLYLGAFLALVGLRFRPAAPSAAGTAMLAIVREGVAYIRLNRLVAGTLVVTLLVNLFGFAYSSMVPVIGERRLALGPAEIGVLMSMEGLGALIGSIAVALGVRASWFTRVYSGGSALFLAMITGFSLCAVYPLAMVALALAGLGIAGFSTMQSTIVLSATEPRMRARVMGVLLVCIGAGPVGVLHVGLLAEWLGAAAAVRTIAIEGLVALGLTLWRWPELLRPPPRP